MTDTLESGELGVGWSGRITAPQPDGSWREESPSTAVESRRACRIRPATMDPSWRFLGYDVADRWLSSGLTNCQYTQSEAAHLSEAHAPLLNEHHRFEND